MNIGDAFKVASKIRKIGWASDVFIMIASDNRIIDCRNEPYEFTAYDLISEDWTPYPRLYTFKEALDYLIKGKQIKRMGWKNPIYLDIAFNLSKDALEAKDWVVL